MKAVVKREKGKDSGFRYCYAYELVCWYVRGLGN